jgi:hypothetical protein
MIIQSRSIQVALLLLGDFWSFPANLSSLQLLWSPPLWIAGTGLFDVLTHWTLSSSGLGKDVINYNSSGLAQELALSGWLADYLAAGSVEGRGGWIPENKGRAYLWEPGTHFLSLGLQLNLFFSEKRRVALAM